MRPGGGRGHGRASVFTAQRKPSQDLRQKYTQPTTAGEGWVGVGGGGPLCGGFSSLENISSECGRGSIPDCCLLLAEMAQCPGKSFKVFERLRLHWDCRDATETDHPTLPQPPHAGGGSTRLVLPRIWSNRS